MKKAISSFALLAIVAGIILLCKDFDNVPMLAKKISLATKKSIVRVEAKQMPINIYVDYQMSIKKIGRVGNYALSNEINDEVFNKEKSSGSDTLNAILLHFQKDFISENEAINWMKHEKLRPATLKELMVFGNQVKIGIRGINVDTIVVALGSVVSSYSHLAVPILYDNEEPFVELLGYGPWNAKYYQFLAIRE